VERGDLESLLGVDGWDEKIFEGCELLRELLCGVEMVLDDFREARFLLGVEWAYEKLVGGIRVPSAF